MHSHEQEPAGAPNNADPAFDAGQDLSQASISPTGAVELIRPEDLDLRPETATAVISSAQKFVIPVPNFGTAGEPLIYPDGAVKDGVDVSGTPILDYKDRVIGEYGIMFRNGEDSCWQAVNGDGSGVIIINQVSEEQAALLMDKIAEFAANPNDLTVEQLKSVLEYAINDLELDDRYDSSRKFIKENMTPAKGDEVPRDADGAEIKAYGFKKRDDRDICYAQFTPGQVSFDGPAVTPQIGDDGLVFVKHGDSIRAIQPDVFKDTYRRADGSLIESPATELAKHYPSGSN